MEKYEDPERIFGYTYKANNKSIYDALFLSRWYNLVFKLVPERVSANLISMIGNLGSWFSFLIMAGLVFGPVEEFRVLSPWVFGFVALGLEFYQTFDALDGMQARRLKTSGPLGEFIDHWFDSLNVFILPFGLCLAFPSLPPFVPIVVVLLATVIDWIELRRVKETNCLDFGYFSSEEGTCTSALFYLSLWLVGYDFWITPVTSMNLVPLDFVVVIGLAGLFLTGFLSLAKYRFAWLPEVAAELVTLLPLALAVYGLQAQWGRSLLILGGLCLGGAGSRIVSDLLRNRLLGLASKTWYVDFLALDALLVIAVFVPGLPSWLGLACFGLYLFWVVVTLGWQFFRTLKRVREKLGIGLFTLPEPAKA